MKSDQNQVKKAAQELGAEIGKDSIGQTSEEETKKHSDAYEKTAERIVQKGLMPKDIIGLSDQMVEGIYGQAYRMYQTGRYTDASQLFRLLVMINSNEAKYLLGLAACFHMLKEYKAATETYAVCAIIDPNNPIPHYHCSDCFIQLNDKISAMIALELAVQRAGDKPEYKNLKDRATLTIESLKKELNQSLEQSQQQSQQPQNK